MLSQSVPLPGPGRPMSGSMSGRPLPPPGRGRWKSSGRQPSRPSGSGQAQHSNRQGCSMVRGIQHVRSFNNSIRRAYARQPSRLSAWTTTAQDSQRHTKPLPLNSPKYQQVQRASHTQLARTPPMQYTSVSSANVCTLRIKCQVCTLLHTCDTTNSRPVTHVTMQVL